ncbi:MAG: glycosyltransferase [Geminicoccaceae bacterium]
MTTTTERVLLISTLYPPNVVGGAEIVVRNLAEGLVRAGHQVCVVTLARRGWAQNRIEAGVSVHEFAMRCRHWPFAGDRASGARRLLWHVIDNFDPDFYRHLRAVVQDFAPTVVNSHNINGLTPAVWLSSRHACDAPIIHTCHDYGLLCSRTTMFNHGRACRSCCATCRVLTAGKRYLTRWVDGAIGVSEAVLAPHLERRLFARGCLTGVIHNANAPEAAPGPAEPPQVARDASPGDMPLRVGFMGRLSAAKGILLLLDELARLDGGVMLKAAGRGDTRLVAELAAARGVPCELPGFVVPSLFYQDVDLLVVPSLWREPLGMVVLEAYGHGVPVIVSNRGGLPELVRDGQGGFVFDPDRPGDLARIIRRLRDDRDALRTAAAAAVTAGAGFTVAGMVDDYLAFYREVRGRMSARSARERSAEAHCTRPAS